MRSWLELGQQQPMQPRRCLAFELISVSDGGVQWAYASPFGLDFELGRPLMWCWLIVIGTWLLILMFSAGGAGPPNLAEIHGASGSGGCDMGACRRGYGRWDFYASASRLKRHGVGAASRCLFCSSAAASFYSGAALRSTCPCLSADSA